LFDKSDVMNKQKLLFFALLLGISIALSSCQGSKIKGCGCGSFSQVEQLQDRPQ